MTDDLAWNPIPSLTLLVETNEAVIRDLEERGRVLEVERQEVLSRVQVLREMSERYQVLIGDARARLEIIGGVS